MQSRHMDPQAEYVYIHTDIKPQNIFIFEGIRDYYSVYKLPKLCDYGIYYRLGVEMVEGPSGTHGFMTPEHYDQARSGHSPLGVSVHIILEQFEIGVIIFSMMMRYRDGFRVIEDAQLLRGNSVAAAIARIENEQGYALDSGMYSARLERLMRSCLSEDYRARPRIENLRREVTRALAAWDAAHGRLKGYNEGDGAPEMHQWLEVRFQDDLEFQRGRPWGPKRQNRHRDRGMGSTNWVSNDPKRRGPEDDEDEEDEDEDESV
ncbi:hypothetical protein B0J11DRAFT_563370 [Dendryphion nanum]|uniref:Protein kinase domain-containing protein n=1 Tax=Dendryphion nanum TaxID=256645 RepID=A0A9P9J169_9PLEO|nr:hypothetical protein B0J11DRAFT_563370 [Dendryphion nanum]